MLLSLYASFRWARSKHYVIGTAIFLVSASLLSAFFALPFYDGPVFFLDAASVLSFPFYSDASLPGANPMLAFYDVHFLTLLIYPVESPPFVIAPFHFAILLFMLVNILSAAFGYWMNKKRIIPQDYGWRSFLMLTAFGIVMIWVGIWLYHEPTWSDALRFGKFGFTWIAAVVWDFVNHYITPKK